MWQIIGYQPSCSQIKEKGRVSYPTLLLQGHQIRFSLEFAGQNLLLQRLPLTLLKDTEVALLTYLNAVIGYLDHGATATASTQINNLHPIPPFLLIVLSIIPSWPHKIKWPHIAPLTARQVVYSPLDEGLTAKLKLKVRLYPPTLYEAAIGGVPAGNGYIKPGAIPKLI